MEVFTITVQKGGTGKTTTAAALAQAAAHEGKRVLAIDLDPQGNFSFALAANTTTKHSIYEVLHGEPLSIATQTIATGFDVIPASWSLSTEKTQQGSSRRLKEILESVKNKYDLVVIDTPAKAGELQYNAIFAATQIIIPLEADIYNLQSFYQTLTTIKPMQKQNKEISIKGFLMTNYDKRSNIVKALHDKACAAALRYGVDYLGSVRAGVAIREAAALQVNLFDYAPRSNPARDYKEIFKKAKII